MDDEPYGYQVWLCSRCDGPLIETEDGLLCETDGFLFVPRGDRAEYVPGSEDDE